MQMTPMACGQPTTRVDRVDTTGGATVSMATSTRVAPSGVSRGTGPDGRRRATDAPPTVTSDADPEPDLRRGGRTSRNRNREVRAAAMGSGVTPASGCERIVALARAPHRTAGPSDHAGPRFHTAAPDLDGQEDPPPNASPPN